MEETPANSALPDKLGPIRQEIDEIDRKLLHLLNRRAALSRDVGKIKADDMDSVFKPRREQELLDKLSRLNPGELPDEHMRAIWREILSSSRALQRKQRIAYLGPKGTFSYFAGLEYMGSSSHFEPCRDIAGIFEKVSGKSCELGLVPLENSLQGTVGVSVDLFLKHDVAIVAELYSRISHALMGKGGSLDAIRKVYSHPQPLAQCGEWLRANLPHAELIPVSSTAAAAQKAATEKDAAALGNANLSGLYSLPILANQVEDNKNNWTRFVVIAKQENNSRKKRIGKGDNKTSAIFTIPDKPGSLARVLDLMGRNGLNMRKLESRPMAGQPWHYVFFVDIENNLSTPEYSNALEQIGQSCLSFRILGSYPQGPRLERHGELNSGEKGE